MKKTAATIAVIFLGLCVAPAAHAGNAGSNDKSFINGQLISAAQDGWLQKVKEYLSQGADVNAKGEPSDYDYTPLMAAATGGHADVVTFLLAKGADVNAKDRYFDDETALMMAAKGGYADVVKMLLAKGADVNAKTGSGSTALMTAAYSERSAVVKELLAKGADVNARDSNGNTALVAAAAGWEHPSRPDVVKMLLAKGADVNAKDRDGNTPLSLAAGNPGGSGIVKELLAKGADVNAKDSNGDTALIMAIKDLPSYHRPDVIKMLLVKGADVHAKDSGGNTALSLAKKYKATGIVVLLEEFIRTGEMPPAQALTGNYTATNVTNGKKSTVWLEFLSGTAGILQVVSRNQQITDKFTYKFYGDQLVVQTSSAGMQGTLLKADSNGCFNDPENMKFCKTAAPTPSAMKAMKAKQAQEAKAREAKQAQEKAAAAAAEKRKALVPKF